MKPDHRVFVVRSDYGGRYWLLKPLGRRLYPPPDRRFQDSGIVGWTRLRPELVRAGLSHMEGIQNLPWVDNLRCRGIDVARVRCGEERRGVVERVRSRVEEKWW